MNLRESGWVVVTFDKNNNPLGYRHAEHGESFVLEPYDYVTDQQIHLEQVEKVSAFTRGNELKIIQTEINPNIVGTKPGDPYLPTKVVGATFYGNETFTQPLSIQPTLLDGIRQRRRQLAFIVFTAQK